MARPKKDGEKVSLFLDKRTMERLRAYAEIKGQSLTTAMERAINGFLDAEEKPEEQLQVQPTLSKNVDDRVPFRGTLSFFKEFL